MMTKVYATLISFLFVLLIGYNLLRYSGFIKFSNESEKDYDEFLNKSMSKKIRIRLLVILTINICLLLYVLFTFD